MTDKETTDNEGKREGEGKALKKVTNAKSFEVTREMLLQHLPRNFHGQATDEFAARLNQINNDPEFADMVKSNFIHYTGVMQTGKYSVEEYLNAVMYNSFKAMGYNNKESYKRVFPERYLKHSQNNPDIINNYVAAYNKSKLVNEIAQQIAVPTWVLNQHTHQQALNTLVSIMTDQSAGAMARVKAADSILVNTKRPEKVEVEVGITSKNKAIDDLNSTLEALVTEQRNAIKGGVKTSQIAEQKLVNGEDDSDVIDAVYKEL